VGNLALFRRPSVRLGFDGSLQLPPRTAEHSDIQQMAREAFHSAAGLPNEWLRCISFLAVHCEIADLMNADAALAVQIPVLVRIKIRAGEKFDLFSEFDLSDKFCSAIDGPLAQAEPGFPLIFQMCPSLFNFSFTNGNTSTSQYVCVFSIFGSINIGRARMVL
jgi:hypothetical protein